MTSLPSSILFVCSENALRSPMAEALTKHRFGTGVYVDSVGVRDGDLDPGSTCRATNRKSWTT